MHEFVYYKRAHLFVFQTNFGRPSVFAGFGPNRRLGGYTAGKRAPRVQFCAVWRRGGPEKATFWILGATRLEMSLASLVYYDKCKKQSGP